MFTYIIYIHIDNMYVYACKYVYFWVGYGLVSKFTDSQRKYYLGTFF